MAESDNIVAETAEKIFADLADAQTINRDKQGDWKAPLWTALTEAGLPLSWVPEDCNGSGASLADGFSVLSSAGRFAVAVPLAETMLAGWLLAQAKISSPEGPMTVAPAGPRDSIKLNAYSSTPAQVDAWIVAWKKSQVLIGERRRGEPIPVERKSIEELKRGVFARTAIEPGTPISSDQIYFAFPIRAGQMASGDWREGTISNVAILPDAPVPSQAIAVPGDSDAKLIQTAVHEVKALIAYARVPIEHTVQRSRR